MREVDIEDGTDFRRVLTEYSVLADAGSGLMTVQRSEDGKMQDQERVYFDGIININSTVFEDCFELPGEGEEDWLPCLGMLDYPDWTVEISDDSSCATCG